MKLTDIFGGNVADFLGKLLGHATTKELQPVVRKQLHKNTSDTERTFLIQRARAFADAYEARRDDEAATALTDILGSFQPL
jgi:hypothetical protein